MPSKKVSVRNWNYHDGWVNVPGILKRLDNTREDREYHPDLAGWHCWAYPASGVDIEAWMKENMSGYYECTFRFNSGDPMYTIFIKEDSDASLFKLKWL